MSLVLNIFGNLILTFAQVYVWYNLIHKKFPFDDKSIFVTIVLLSGITFACSSLLNETFNGIGIMILSIIFCKIIINEDIKNCIIISFLGELLLILSEALFAVLVTFIFNIQIISITNYMYIADILVAIISLLLSKLYIFYKCYNYIKKITSNVKLYQLLLFFIFTIFEIGFAFASTYLNKNVRVMIIVNIIISIFYSVIVILIFRYQHKYYKIKSKYNLSLDSLQSQEQMINDYKILNHENNNNLQTIKRMTSNKKVIGYINSLLKEKDTIDNDLIKDSLKLPAGGIRGLIYNKMLFMKSLNIKYFLEVDKAINTRKMININDDDIVDICQIVGVFLDNAIEETRNHLIHEITINLYIYCNKIYISISNYYDGNLNNLNNKRIKSTKGSGRGYGLKLVNKIIDNNNRLSHNIKIMKNIVTQIVIIEI